MRAGSCCTSSSQLHDDVDLVITFTESRCWSRPERASQPPADHLRREPMKCRAFLVDFDLELLLPELVVMGRVAGSRSDANLC